ncbi:MAG: polysaccharide biosynthesis C-terminal domain-containing protein [Candidatus Krumholzibacteriota bacterium]|nr:polysaccharide biosynthesis C-terminal domain-containing protein [Candidatus Krumholzibacteriota bacterium]
MAEAPGGGDKRLRSMLSDSFYVAIGTYATHFLSLFINLILVRKLSLANYGVYSVMLSTYAMGTLLLSLGAVAIVQRYLPEMLAKGNRRGAIRLEILGALIHLAAGLIICGFCAAFRGQLSAWLNTPEFAGLLPYFCLFLIFKFEAQVFDEMLTAHRRQKYRNLVVAAFQALKLGLFLFALPYDGSVATVLLYLLLSNLLLLLANAGRILGLSHRIRDTLTEDLPWKRMIRFGLLRYTTSITLVGFFADIDIWFITHFHGTEQAGLYGFATKIVNMLATMMPTHYLLVVIVPVYVAEYTRRQDPQQLIKVFRFYNKVVSVFLVPALVGTLLLASPIVAEIFDPKYLPSVTALRVFFFGMFWFFFFNTSSFLLVVLEKPEITLYSRVFVIYNVIMDLVLIPRLGILGAAIATGSAMAFGYIFTYLMVRRAIAIRIPWRATLRTALYTGAMALVLWPFLGRIHGVLPLLGVIGLGAAVYGLLAWRLPVFDREERERLNAAFGRRLFAVPAREPDAGDGG